MNVSIWVVVLLVLLSGVIAAVGDWLGRRLGKKRLRLGRLRPKHTAILTTAVAGMLITLLTIVVLAAFSEQVRVWLTEGTEVQRELRETRGQLGETERQLESGKTLLAGVTEELEGEREKLADEQAKVAAAVQEASEMRAEAASLKGQVASLNRDLSENRAKLVSIQADFNRLTAESNRLVGDIKRYGEEQVKIFRENNELLKQNDLLSQDIERLERQIGGLNAQVESTQEAQRIATASFEAERKQIEADRKKALDDLNAAEGSLRKAREDLAKIQSIARVLSTETTLARLNPLIYNRGDEMSRLAVRSGLTPAEARTYLLATIAAASRDALGRGAVESPASSSAAAFGSFDTPDGTPLTPEIQFQQALQQITAKDTELVIVARAIMNAFHGEWVRIMIDVRPNPVVYRLGEFIIETRVDGRGGVQAVTESLVNFMSNQLRQRAESDGMVPAIGRPTELGSISQETLQQIVRDIVDTERTITVRFHAAADTKAGDLLTLDVRLR
ncbi:MAG: DUF3084 domain-containing protein [Fimbriimonadaceae bacterium]